MDRSTFRKCCWPRGRGFDLSTPPSSFLPIPLIGPVEAKPLRQIGCSNCKSYARPARVCLMEDTMSSRLKRLPTLSNRSFATSHGRSDRHHGKIQPRQRTSAPPLVLVTETSFRLRVIYSTCSNRKMSCRRGSAGRRSCCDPKVFTALARRKAATKPPSSGPFAKHYAPLGEFGWPPTATARVSSSASKFLSITNTAVRRCGCCSLRRTPRPSAMHSVGQNQIANMLGFTPPRSHADRPTRSTTYHSRAPRPSFLGEARGESSALAGSRRRP
jgi:hypothetical protein